MNNTVQLNHDVIEEIANRLVGDQTIQFDLNTGLIGRGRIFIDRQQPFLCVYREPREREDPGTETLLYGQASYIVASHDLASNSLFQSLVTRVLSILHDLFGAVLLIEVGAFESDDLIPDAEQKPPARLQITAPTHDVPAQTVAALERTFLSATWPLGDATIQIDYGNFPAPRDYSPLLTRNKVQELNVAVFNLEISADYQNKETGALYPNILNAFQSSFTHVLKQTVFAFGQEKTRHALLHFHEVGPRVLGKAVLEVDRKLSSLSGAFDLLLHISPVNTSQAWQAFRASRFEKEPEFHYRALPADPGALKRDLFNIDLDTIEDPALFDLFRAKRDELDRELTLLASRESQEFLYGSLALFGRVEGWLLDLARDILVEIPPHTHDDNVSDNVSAREFAEYASAEVTWYARQSASFAPKVEVRSDVPGLMVSQGNLLIPNKSRFARARIDAAINHEVGTHMVTFHNGGKQPFHQLQYGTAGYEELQEGLAVFSEFLVGGLSRPRFRKLAGRVVAARSMIDGAGFVDTYRMLHDEYGFSQYAAYVMTMRTFRGGGYVKDQIYLRGLVKLLQHLQNGVAWETLWVGKIAFDQIEIIEELLWRRVLSRDILQPRYMERDDVRDRLKKVREGVDIFDLIAMVES